MNTEHDMPAPNYARRIYRLIIGLVVVIILGVGGFLIYNHAHQQDLARKCATAAAADGMIRDVIDPRHPIRDC